MSLPSLRCALLLGALLMAAPRLPAQELESIGPLPVFEFHSGFWMNLHHFLYHEARARLAGKNQPAPGTKSATPTLKPSPAATITLSPAEQRTWDQVLAYYTSNYAQKDLLVNLDLILLKDQLGDFEDCSELTGHNSRRCDAGLPGNIGPMLEAAAPIYRAHWWHDHDRANRRWVARVAPLVREQGVGLSERLADIYQTHWPKEKIRVEVVAFANPAGAYTTLDPLRVTISSTDPRNQGPEALEVLFHEASHDIAQPVDAAIRRECKQRDKPIPRDLWHALIIYTTGEVLRPVMNDSALQELPATQEDAPKQNDRAAQKDATTQNRPDDAHSPSASPPKPNQVPSALRDILSQRGWDEYHLLLTLYWQPYLDGKVNFDDAIAHLISAV